MKPDKDKSQGKIDGVVSMIYALDRLMRSNPKKRPVLMPIAVSVFPWMFIGLAAASYFFTIRYFLS